METVEVTLRSPDQRIVRPSLLLARIDEVTALADAENLADEVSQAVADDDSLLGFDPWRQSYTEERTGPGQHILLMSRWPVEDQPVVTVIDNGIVDATTYRVIGNNRHALYRDFGWTEAVSGPRSITGTPRFPTTRLYYTLAYTAGYLMPGQIVEWGAALAVKGSGSASYGESPGWVRATDRTVTLVFEASAGGALTSGSEPIWPTVVGETVADNTVTWTARAAATWPAWAESASADLAGQMFGARGRDRTWKSMETDDIKVTYRDTSGGTSNSAGFEETFRRLR